MPGPPAVRRVAQLWLVATLIAAGATFAVARDAAMRSLVEQAARRGNADALVIESTLAKNDALPFVMSLQPAVSAGLLHANDPAAVQTLDRYLAEVATQSRVAAAYVVDREGLTIAASNWRGPLSFVGQNYRFRPYMQEALAGRVGRFYGIGTTTTEPGYFLARPVRTAGGVIGAVVLKIQLDDIEASWGAVDDPVVLADADGVVFLANRATWKYRSFEPLAPDVRARIAASRQYGDRPIATLAADAPSDGAGRVGLAVGPLGWRLWYFVSSTAATIDGVAAAAAVLVASLLVALAAYAAHQRRARIATASRARDDLERAAAALEATIASRTAEVTRANADLRDRFGLLHRTERMLRATQDELVQAGKLGMLGQMAAGTVHELAQPLTALKAFAKNAEAYLARGQYDAARGNMAHIDAACDRMQRIVSQLKSFARRSDEALVPVRIAEAVDHALLLLAPDVARSDARVDVDIDGDAAVLADPTRLEQVFVNLLRNALDAVRGAPVRVVRVRCRTGADDEAVMFEVIDSGPGISSEAEVRLFEPFFTTKPPGEGLGLGLAISSAIVQAMRGTMRAGRDDGGGAAFAVTLPRVVKAEVAA